MTAIANLPDLRPSLLLDFANSECVDPRIQCTRASTATCFGPDGKLRTVAANVPRIDYDPVTGKCLGLLVEESRSNMVANNGTSGAVVGVLGSGGSLPTGWSAPTSNGLTAEVLSIGVEDGIPYIDVRFYGTATTNYQGMIFGNVSGYAPSTAYVGSIYTKLLSGGIPATGAVQFKIRYNHSTGSTDINGVFNNSSFVADKLRANRLPTTGTTSSNSTGAGQLLMVFNYTTGTVIDFSLRLGLPQLEAGSGPTTPILTNSAAVTRAADAIGMNIQQPNTDYSVALTYRTGKKLAAMRSLTLRNSIDGKTVEFFAAGLSGTNRNGVVVSGSSGNPAVNQAPTPDTIYKAALSIKGSKFSFAADGAVLASAQPHTATPPNTIWFGATGLGNGLHLCGDVMRVALYGAALSDEQINRLAA